MNESQKLCPKCQAEMEEGFIPDRGDSNVLQTSSWYRGLPQKSFWTGLKNDGIKFQVQSYRCTGCGYLESYAT